MSSNNTFYLMLALFSSCLYFINLVFNKFVYEILFIIPLWKIYLFNVALVLITFWTIKLITKTKLSTLSAFVIASINKMLLTVVFISPVIDSEGDKEGLVLTFFVIYFVFLFFEIKSLQKVFLR